MCRYKNGNPKRASRFLCIKHLGENYLGSGIQRGRNQREKFHCKDLYCLQCGEVTKNMEIRWCDTYNEIYERAVKERMNYYPETENKSNRKVG